ncbi:pH-gated potassium channel KcsA [Mycobacterium innocens]|uniref:pH-gated potassium channel KcsA n=1 Tax=Mycobacterium innocens TaxID=2341083 RepID=A0A498Q6F1_9MYCO|nr:pH-gated potassium channel KcsA [Mycobacterium innocens]
MDYLVRLALAPDRRQWFVQHIFDLLIVALPMMRPLRLLRLVVLVGALQKAVGNAVRGRILIYTISGISLLVYITSLAILDQERGHPGATIDSFGKALWWATTTVTTVSYGNLYPVTVTGRVIAVLLMIGGISLIGVVTASVASWIVQAGGRNRFGESGRYGRADRGTTYRDPDIDRATAPRCVYSSWATAVTTMSTSTAVPTM